MINQSRNAASVVSLTETEMNTFSLLHVYTYT